MATKSMPTLVFMDVMIWWSLIVTNVNPQGLDDLVAPSSLLTQVLTKKTIWWPPNHYKVSIGRSNNLVVTKLLQVLVLNEGTI
jgi:hypothetical protein